MHFVGNEQGAFSKLAPAGRVILLLLCCALLGCWRCNPPAPAPPRPAKRFGGDPLLQRLSDGGARVQHPTRARNGDPVTEISFQGKRVSSETLADVARVPGNVVLVLHACEVMPNALAELDAMEGLYNLGLEGTGDEALCELHRLPGLRHFSLYNAKGVTADGLSFIVHSPRLESLSLRRTEVGDEEMAVAETLQQLSDLNIAETLVTDVGFKYLERLPQLLYLDATDCRIGDAGIAHLAGVTSLRTLSIPGTQITDNALTTIAKFSWLEFLDVSRTQITDEGLLRLAPLAKLEGISIRHTAISDVGLAHLAPLPSLGRVHALGTRVTKAGRKVLPISWLEFDGSHDSQNREIP